jgi:hypothetical protein
MPVTFKLVGSINTNVLEIKRNMVGLFKLSHFQSLFETYGLEKEDIEQLKFVANSESIKDNEKIFTLTSDQDFVIFVFSANKDVREKLSTIFENNNTNISGEKKKDENQVTSKEEIQINSKEEVDANLTKKIYLDEVEKVPILDDETVSEINIKSSKLFQSEDFKTLIRIFYKNQDIFKTFFSFITSGDIINLSIPESAKDKKYDTEIQMLQSLGIDQTVEEIEKVLKLFNGNMNLALRIFLVRNSVLFDEKN